MVKVKNKVFVSWKSCVVRQGHTVNTVRRHNILQSPTSSREDRGGPYPRVTGGAVQEVAATEQAPEPEHGPVPCRVRKQDDVQAWIEIRPSLHIPAVESLCPPPNPCCHICQCGLDSEEIWKCGDCDSQAMFCSPCIRVIHTKFNMLHVMELWDGNTNTYVRREPNAFRWEWRRHDGHTCMTPYQRQLHVFDQKARVHHVLFTFCECESEHATLIRLGLWPGSPRRPNSAISLGLMRLLSVLQLECGISIRGMSSAIQEAFPSTQVLDLYSILIKECYEEYRHWQFQQTACSVLAPSLADGASCPMCPKENGTLCVAADALFGLPRKKSSGESFEAPKHKERFFLKQSEVDTFVEKANAHPEGGCPGFRAGSAIRSKVRYKKLDETGVFGLTCRHEHPVKFLNLKYGERLSNAVLLLKELSKEQEEHQLKIVFMYDIACKLKPHLQRHYPLELMNNKDFVVPVFHSYGHNLACQFEFNTRFHKGTGLADGEQSERLWSYLRKFGKITKEMTPSHRTDLLTDALLHYSAKVQRKQITGIPQRLLKAEKIKEESMKELTSLLKSLPGTTVEDIRSWGKNLQDSLQKKEEVSFSWEEMYVENLQQFQRGQSQLETSQGGTQVVDLISRTEKAERKIRAVEKKHHVEQRWSLTSPQAQTFLSSAMEKRAKEVLNNIFNLTVERKFMCGLVRKYAEGQTIAVRLSRQITKLNSKIKASTKLYNIKREAIPSTNLPSLTFEMAIDMDAGVWSQQGQGDDPAFYLKQRLFVLVSLSDRASEERNLIREDLKTAEAFFHLEMEKAQEALLNYPSSSRFDHGAVAALSGKLNQFQQQLDICGTMSQHFETDCVGIVEDQFADCDDSSDDDEDEEEEEEEEEGGETSLEIAWT